ncbi:MAG: hypothetical protein AAGA48_28580 [Myxococcota bacterium]
MSTLIDNFDAFVNFIASAELTDDELEAALREEEIDPDATVREVHRRVARGAWQTRAKGPQDEASTPSLTMAERRSRRGSHAVHDDGPPVFVLRTNEDRERATEVIEKWAARGRLRSTSKEVS